MLDCGNRGRWFKLQCIRTLYVTAFYPSFLQLSPIFSKVQKFLCKFLSKCVHESPIFAHFSPFFSIFPPFPPIFPHFPPFFSNFLIFPSSENPIRCIGEFGVG